MWCLLVPGTIYFKYVTVSSIYHILIFVHNIQLTCRQKETNAAKRDLELGRRYFLAYPSKPNQSSSYSILRLLTTERYKGHLEERRQRYLCSSLNIKNFLT